MIACVFSGQGAQFVGMGKDLAGADPVVMSLYDNANKVLGFDLKSICFDGPQEALTRSDVCQPAIFVTSMACYAAFKQVHPTTTIGCYGGLSLGEWTALCAAGVLNFENTLKILQVRGRWMQEACEMYPGGMLSVMGATEEQLTAICDAADIDIANINSATQVVLSGSKDGIEKAKALCAEQKLKAIPLQVAGAFHSPLMACAREKLTAFIENTPFSPPDTPVYSNVTGKPHELHASAIRDTMLKQVTNTVRWSSCVQHMIGEGIHTFIEFGPGNVLSGLIGRIDKTVKIQNVQDLASLQAIQC